MIGEALEITIVVSMLVLIAYPSTLMAMDALQAHRKRRTALARGQRHRIRSESQLSRG